MIRTLVVDDNAYALKGISRLIVQTHPGFCIVGEAYDGEEALQLIKLLKPDLIFTDIRMPIMDGLKLVEAVKAEYPHIIMVIISAYSDFEYAKAAIRFGVKDYLLKPSSPAELEALLYKLYESIVENRDTKRVKILKDTIMSGNLCEDHSSLKELFEEFSQFAVINMCAGSYRSFPCMWLIPSTEFWLAHSLESIVSGELSSNESFWILQNDKPNERIIVIASRLTQYTGFISSARNIHNALTTYGMPITTIVSKLSSSLDDLIFAYQETQIYLQKDISFGFSRFSMTGSKEIDLRNNIDPLGASQEKSFNILVQNYQVGKLKDEIKNVLQLYRYQQASQLKVESFLKRLANLIYQNRRSTVQKSIEEIELEISEIITSSTTYESVLEGMGYIIDELIIQNQSNNKAENTSVSSLIDVIENYIRKNYANMISLQSIADEFGITPSYLSKIFKKIKGVSPSDMIIGIRISKAKELLSCNPPILLKDIAESVGYSDPFYFSRIFKSFTGQSPSDFRSK